MKPEAKLLLLLGYKPWESPPPGCAKVLAGAQAGRLEKRSRFSLTASKVEQRVGYG